MAESPVYDTDFFIKLTWPAYVKRGVSSYTDFAYADLMKMYVHLR